jgi:hypothetical protein
MAEEFVIGVVDAVHHEIKRIGPLLLMLKSLNAKTEDIWLLDSDWKPTEDPKKAWVKAIVDVHYLVNGVLYVKDYKSGQMYPDHRNQLELYALMGLRMYPDVKRVEFSAVYMDTGHEGAEGSLIPAMSEKMILSWDTDAKAMMADEVYEPKPGPACKWCPFTKAKGGPCAY